MPVITYPVLFVLYTELIDILFLVLQVTQLLLFF